ncbi:hypothetical protein [Candidatus Nitrososphaera gargensis]|uniref:hypothetical protein n=1 Tax=Candidatus Nitrososphaera gargensis TaxID=497727 RepID=UPI001E57CE7D|nr:hypothetical protein [Candidatus Nitrososphaera gargensis]
MKGRTGKSPIWICRYCNKRLVACVEPRKRQPPEVPSTLPEGDNTRYRQVQEPRKGVSSVRQKAQEDILGDAIRSDKKYARQKTG